MGALSYARLSAGAVLTTLAAMGARSETEPAAPVVARAAARSSAYPAVYVGPAPQRTQRLMTGGGRQLAIATSVSVSRGLSLACDIKPSTDLEISWRGNGRLNSFRVTRPLTSARCMLDPAYSQPRQALPFNTFVGRAMGTLNGAQGAVARFVFVDAGEPSGEDLSQIQIWDGSGYLALNVPLQPLSRGGLEAHYDEPHRYRR